MRVTRKNLVLWIFAFVVVFSGFFILISNIQSCPNPTKFQTSLDPDNTQNNLQARKLMGDISEAFETASAKVSVSVVSIFAEQTVQAQNPFGMPDDPFKEFFGEDFFKRFFGTPGPQEERQTVRSLGSGVIVSRDGYILTNNHVVAGAEKLSVVIGKSKTYQAKIIGTDPPTDVAVIKIAAKDLPVATLGQSESVKVGQWVIAVGNPFQLMHTVTAGIISAKGRSSVGLADYEDFIQTDASINPGNSGGALADLEGNVIGINTAIASPSGGNIGIGFAIPIDMAKRVMDELMSEGEVVRGYVGLYLQDLNEELAKALDLEGTKGVIVSDVEKDGPAEKAGLKRGDVIVAFDGKEIENGAQLKNLVAMTRPKTKVEVDLIRDGKRMNLTVMMGERPKSTDMRRREPGSQEGQTSKKLGISIQTLTPDIASQLGYQNENGVVVTNVVPGSAADDAGLQRGDLIKEINRRKVRSVEDFEEEAKKLKSGDSVALLLRRGANTFFVAITVE